MLVLQGSSCGSLPDVPVTATACTLLTNISSQCSLNTRVVLKYMRACCEGGLLSVLPGGRWQIWLHPSRGRFFAYALDFRWVYMGHVVHLQEAV